MKSIPTYFAITALIFTIILTGCEGIESIEITGINNFKLSSIEENTITFSADVGILNPSGVAFRVREVNLRAITGGNYLGTLVNNEIIRITSRSDSVYNMFFNLELVNILTGASMLYGISKQDQVNVELQGYVKSRSGLITKKVNIQESLIIDVPGLDFFN
ncbi:MAG: hypothetical protein JXB19_04980 [Bacteroidales bacterium]|nr:hypothetical protein [Bacteroidales bacterium]